MEKTTLGCVVLFVILQYISRVKNWTVQTTAEVSIKNFISKGVHNQSILEEVANDTITDIKVTPTLTTPFTKDRNDLYNSPVSNEQNSPGKAEFFYRSEVKSSALTSLNPSQKLPLSQMDAIIEKDKSSLLLLIKSLINKELKGCDMIIVYDKLFNNSSVVAHLSRFSNVKQMIIISDGRVLEDAIWVTPNCLGSIFLITETEKFLEFGGRKRLSWNYNARVMFVGLTKTQLEELFQTRRLKKTEHILGLVEGRDVDHYLVYRNNLYWKRGGMTQVASWTGRSLSGSLDFFPDKISNLQKNILNVITFEFPPSIIYQKARNGALLFRYGLEVAVVEALARVRNFTISYSEPPSGERWGVILPNGSWNGLVGLLASGAGDMGIANIFVSGTPERLESLDFSFPFDHEATCYLSRTEPPLPRWQSLGLPFQTKTWIALVVGLLLAGPLLYCLAVASAHRGVEQRNLQSLAYSSLYSFGVHFRHPYSSLPLRPSAQVFLAFLLLYCIILTTSYGSNLTAFLTVARQPASMDTFKELYETRSKVFDLGKFFKHSMASSVNKYLNALSEHIYQIPSFEEIKPKILDGEGVMIQSRRYLEYVSVQLVTPSGEPKVRIMKECFAHFGVGIAFQSNSPLKTKFDPVISRMVEGGLVGRWFSETIKQSQMFEKLDRSEEKGDAPNEDAAEETSLGNDGFIPLGLDHMQGIFITLVFGYVVATASCLVEMSIANMRTP